MQNISKFNGVEDQFTEEMILKKEFDKEYIARIRMENEKKDEKKDDKDSESPETVRSS